MKVKLRTWKKRKGIVTINGAPELTIESIPSGSKKHIYSLAAVLRHPEFFLKYSRKAKVVCRVAVVRENNRPDPLGEDEPNFLLALNQHVEFLQHALTIN